MEFELDWEDPIGRIIIIAVIVILVVGIVFGGYLLRGGQNGWKNNFDWSWNSDNQSKTSYILIYNSTEDENYVKPKVLKIQSVKWKAKSQNGSTWKSYEQAVDIILGPEDEPLKIVFDGACKKVKVTKIVFSVENVAKSDIVDKLGYNLSALLNGAYYNKIVF